jgi:predicted  nucleic acid-binding Zn-ribbon protein
LYSADAIVQLQNEVSEEKERSGGLEDTIVQLNEEIDLISTQKIKLAAECEQNMEQVRELVMSKSMTQSEGLQTMKAQIDQLSHSVRLKDEEVKTDRHEIIRSQQRS